MGRGRAAPLCRHGDGCAVAFVRLATFAIVARLQPVDSASAALPA